MPPSSAWSCTYNLAYFMLVSCLTYFSTLKLELTHSSKTSVDFQRTTRPHISETQLFIILRSNVIRAIQFITKINRKTRSVISNEHGLYFVFLFYGVYGRRHIYNICIFNRIQTGDPSILATWGLWRPRSCGRRNKLEIYCNPKVDIQ
jgi:hypothetical protein